MEMERFRIIVFSFQLHGVYFSCCGVISPEGRWMDKKMKGTESRTTVNSGKDLVSLI